MLNSFQHPWSDARTGSFFCIWSIAFTSKRYTFHRRPKDGIFRCDLDKERGNLLRLDTFLSISRLIKRRTQAKKACEFGAVLIDGTVAKPSHNVKISQKIQIDFSNRVLEVKVLSMPTEKNVRKDEARNLVKVIKEERKKVLDE